MNWFKRKPTKQTKLLSLEVYLIHPTIILNLRETKQKSVFERRLGLLRLKVEGRFLMAGLIEDFSEISALAMARSAPGDFYVK